MNFKAKNLRWFAGRPVIILSPKAAKLLNVHVNERVAISIKNQRVYAVVDIFSDLIKDNEAGFSREILDFISVKNGSNVDVVPADVFLGGQIIKKKLSGATLSEGEINFLISEISKNTLTEPEIAFFVAAEKTQGMSKNELIALTSAMIKTGNTIKTNKKIVADKHCIGGIAGNRTTPLVVAICSAAGLIMPKTSSRAITSAAGTADTIETIARVEFTKDEMIKIMKKVGACLIWNGSLNLSPSDDKIIHVERIIHLDVEPQLIASIMSKKIAAGSNHILIDIPYGGGKISTLEKAKELGKKFEYVASHFKVKLKIVYTPGNQPIGNGIGPILEMKDIISVLKNDGPLDLKEKSLFLSSRLMDLCGVKNSEKVAREILESGKAYEKFKEIVNTQNNKKDFDKRIKKLKLGKHGKTIFANREGIIKFIDNKKINLLARVLGAPETKGAGIYLHRKLGKVPKGEKILTLYSESEDKLKDALKYFEEFEPIVLR
jgi:AMP phosphorylase